MTEVRGETVGFKPKWSRLTHVSGVSHLHYFDVSAAYCAYCDLKLCLFLGSEREYVMSFWQTTVHLE